MKTNLCLENCPPTVGPPSYPAEIIVYYFGGIVSQSTIPFSLFRGEFSLGSSNRTEVWVMRALSRPSRLGEATI